MPFCTQCGVATAADHRFCAQCGTALPAVGTATGAALRRASPPAVPEPPISNSRATPPRATGDAAPPRQPGSLLWTGDDELAEPHARDTPLWRRALVAGAAGVLLVLLAALATVTYRSSKSVEHSTAPPAVEATEATVAPAGSGAVHDPVAVAEFRWIVLADDTRQTTNTADALGPPDEKTAAVAPGGRLAVASESAEPFYNGPGADVEISGPAGEPARYTIYARERPEGQWVRFDVHRQGFADGAAGHDMGHHGLHQAREIMIRNDGTTDLHIDAVRPRYRTPVEDLESHAGPHRD